MKEKILQPQDSKTIIKKKNAPNNYAHKFDNLDKIVQLTGYSKPTNY